MSLGNINFPKFCYTNLNEPTEVTWFQFFGTLFNNEKFALHVFFDPDERVNHYYCQVCQKAVPAKWTADFAGVQQHWVSEEHWVVECRYRQELGLPLFDKGGDKVTDEVLQNQLRELVSGVHVNVELLAKLRRTKRIMNLN